MVEQDFIALKSTDGMQSVHSEFLDVVKIHWDNIFLFLMFVKHILHIFITVSAELQS